MPRTITKTVYTFKELLDLHAKGEVTATAIDKARGWLSEVATDVGWYDYVYDLWKQALEQIGFMDPEINFSGFWRQGDGASFTATIDIEKLAEFMAAEIEPKNCIEGDPEDFRPWIVHRIGCLPANPKYRRLAGLHEHLYPCKVVRNDHRYSHEYTCRVSIEFNRWGRADKVEKLLRSFEEDTEELRRDLCSAIYRDLEDKYESVTSDEYILDMAEANDWTFTIHGRHEW
jgi:hypothetical protein